MPDGVADGLGDADRDAEVDGLGLGLGLGLRLGEGAAEGRSDCARLGVAAGVGRVELGAGVALGAGPPVSANAVALKVPAETTPVTDTAYWPGAFPPLRVITALRLTDSRTVPSVVSVGVSDWS